MSPTNPRRRRGRDDAEIPRTFRRDADIPRRRSRRGGGFGRDRSAAQVHPGYGFLSESPELAKLCEERGIAFVGPTVENLLAFSDKTSARAMAIKAGVPVVPGTDAAMSSAAEAKEFAKENGLPLMIKASMGGGGKGMRIARSLDDIEAQFEAASSEALAAFGDGSCFLERYVEDPRHVEIQIVGDGDDVVHLWERDCSVQRRHQKVVEMAPAWNLNDALRKRLQDDAVKLGRLAGYKNAGTVEFLVDVKSDEHFFIEVNPRIQVEHTAIGRAANFVVFEMRSFHGDGAVGGGSRRRRGGSAWIFRGAGSSELDRRGMARDAAAGGDGAVGGGSRRRRGVPRGYSERPVPANLVESSGPTDFAPLGHRGGHGHRPGADAVPHRRRRHAQGVRTRPGEHQAARRRDPVRRPSAIEAR